MTPQQRSDAARKASATRKANKAAGIAPAAKGATTGRRRGGPVFASAKPTTRGLKLVVLAALEDLFVVALRDTGITPEVRKAYDRYTKLKAMALHPGLNPESQVEADSALRTSTVELVKLTF